MPDKSSPDLKDVIQSVLASRNKTLSIYQEVMTYKPFKSSSLLREVLEDLCEQLVDYSGNIHFNFLNTQLKNPLLEDTALAVLKESSPFLIDNTQKILDFQDAYNSDLDEVKMANLTAELNKLGEVIAKRVLLEDKLINSIIK